MKIPRIGFGQVVILFLLLLVIVQWGLIDSESAFFNAASGMGILLLAVYVAYKELLEPPRVVVAIGEVYLCRTPDGVRGLNLDCSFYNDSHRPTMVWRAALVLADKESKALLKWSGFYDYATAKVMQNRRRPIPIPLPGRSGTTEGIQFMAPSKLPTQKGSYCLTLLVWYGRSAQNTKPPIIQKYEFDIDDETRTSLRPTPSAGELNAVPVYLADTQVLEDVEKYLK